MLLNACKTTIYEYKMRFTRMLVNSWTMQAVQLLKGENEPIDMKQKSTGGRSLMLDACDLDDYSNTTYLKDLNRHMQLVME